MKRKVHWHWGLGFGAAFLGLLHMEIVQARLEKEFGISIILTAPSVSYRIFTNAKGIGIKKDIAIKKGEPTTEKDGYIIIDNPMLFPDPNKVSQVQEPYIRASIITPHEYLGSIIQLGRDRRGIQSNLQYLSRERVELKFDLPLAEVVFDFYDKLKSVSRGYASFDYAFLDYRDADVSKVEILVNKESVDALCFLVHRDKARARANSILEKLKEEIPRHMFQIPLQAAIGSTIIARENISAKRKDVTAKCYGGDITRKRKLLEKQKKGKRKMKMIGSVEIPDKTFLSVLKS